MSQVSPQVALRYTKTFKKYTEEYAPAVVEFVRTWAKTTPLSAFHEDASIVKVTGTKPEIDGLLATLKEKFAYIPPEEREGAKKSDEPEES